jgi:chitinase
MKRLAGAGRKVRVLSRIVLATLAFAAGWEAAAREPAALVAANDRRIVAYYASWTAYRGFTPGDVDPSDLTHVNYAFARITRGEILLGDAEIDPKNLEGLRRLRGKNPALGLIASVGGWTGSQEFSDVALDEASRRRFAESAVTFLRTYGFDGLDVDWEHPVTGGREGNAERPEDKSNFTLLLRALREALDGAGAAEGKRYLLTIAAGASPRHVSNLELGEIARVVDWINVMAYDLHGTWATTSGHNAPLFADPANPSPGTVAAAVEAYLEAGVPPTKLTLGFALHGHAWQGCAPRLDGQYQTCAGPARGTWEDGILEHRDIDANYLRNPAFVRRFNDAAKVPFLFDAATGRFVSYDDTESFRHKIAFLKAKGLGGAMVWELSADPMRTLLGRLAKEVRSAPIR